MASHRLVEVSDGPSLVVPIYLLTILPLALYVYHDILNARFRRVQNLHMYAVAYTWLYISSAIVVFGYMVVQAMAGDFKEVGASLVAILLGAYGFWKCRNLRVAAFLSFPPRPLTFTDRGR
jgi:hypothetical protein